MARQIEHQRLLDLSASGEEDPSAKVLATAIEWQQYSEVSGAAAKLFGSMHGVDAEEGFKQCQAEGAAAVTAALGAALKIKAPGPPTYALALFTELGRTNPATYNLLQTDKLLAPLLEFLGRGGATGFAADCAAYLASALFVSTDPGNTAAGPESFVKNLFNKTYNVSEVGQLDAVVNLLKQPSLRSAVWSSTGVQSKLTDFRTDSPVPVLYKCIFGVWMVSCSAELLPGLKQLGTIPQLRKIVSTSRTEKVVRVALLALKNLLENAETAEEVVEAGTLEAVEALEYEKWRDPEVYDSVKSVTSLVQKAVTEHSNFARYEREIKMKKLCWGFIHSEKFWLQNYTAFEKDDFAVVKALVEVVSDERADSQTLAVACHDLGEFARLHPSGKAVLSRWPRAKAAVMQAMTHSDREVAREALLCTQKLMLNRWQDLQEGK